jgi:fructan beta-fructosidase
MKRAAAVVAVTILATSPAATVTAGPAVGVPGSVAAPFPTADPWRPGVHYTPERNWMNDPNGLVYIDGTWHMYYQYSPTGPVWSNISWGHATSTDLVHWTEQPLAVPQTLNSVGLSTEDIYSGSVVVDEENTSGLGTAENPPLVALYTSNNTVLNPGAPLIQAQSVAYSVDGGFTWDKYAGNPVLDRDSRNFRDPKVFRYSGDAGDYWVMAVVDAEEHRVLLYRSDDLLDWDYLSDVGPTGATGGVWECPDLFELPVDGDPGNTRWVLTVNLNPGAVGGGSGGQYFVGDFNGTTFTPDGTGEQWLDYGRDYYAAVSYDNVPDGRRIMTGWMSNWQYSLITPFDPASPWRSGMSLPREVTLTDTGDRISLAQRPVSLDGYREEDAASSLVDLPVPEGRHPLPVDGDLLEVDLTLDPGTADRAGITVRESADGREGTKIGYDATTGQVFVDRRNSGITWFSPDFPSVSGAPVRLSDGRIRMRVYVDRSSVEVFSDDGTRTLTDVIYPDAASTGISAFAEGGDATLTGLTVTPLRSARP